MDPDPILRQPVNLGSKNVRGIIKSVTDGTAEVKDLILNECDVIFECKSCRSLFRSLCNFLEHKRQFCLTHACEKMLLYHPQRIRQETDARLPETGNDDMSLQMIEPADPAAAAASSDTPAVIEKTEILSNGIQIPAPRRARRLDVCIQKLTQDKQRTVAQKVPALILTPITGTTQAVSQSQVTDMELEADNAEPDAEADAKVSHNDLNGHGTDQPAADDSAMAQDQSPGPPAASATSDVIDKVAQAPPAAAPIKKKTGRSARCGICGSDFVSNKTLRVHMKTLHASQRLIYPCPFCCLTFTQICNATRHMHQVHKKGKLDVKRLRDIVRMRAKVADDGGGGGRRSKSPEKQESDPGFHEDEDMDLTPDADQSPAAADDDPIPDPEVPHQDEQQQDNNDNEKSVSSETGHVCQGCNKFFPRIASKIGHEKVCESLKKSARKKVKSDPISSTTFTSASCRAEDLFHPFDAIYDNEPITITAVIKAGLQKVASTKKLRCFECPTLKFKNNVHLIRHAVAHMNEEIFACNDCVYQSLSKADIDSHAATEHGNEPVRGSPPNKIIIKPSEIVTIRDAEFSLTNDSDSTSSSSRQPIRAVSAYNTTRLKTRKRKVFKKRVLTKKPLLPPIQNVDPAPPSVTPQPQLPHEEKPTNGLLVQQQEQAVDPLLFLPPPPPLMPQPVLVPSDLVSDIPALPEVPPPVPALVPAAPVLIEPVNGQDEADSPVPSRNGTSTWTTRPNKKMRRLVPSLPVVPVIKPFGGQIAKRIRQAKKINYKEQAVTKSHPETKSAGDVPHPSSDQAIQPLKILIHKEVTSGKKTTYAVSSITDQNP
jgi:hypothetical protein